VTRTSLSPGVRAGGYRFAHTATFQRMRFPNALSDRRLAPIGWPTMTWMEAERFETPEAWHVRSVLMGNANLIIGIIKRHPYR
jgi:hypothetical protein